MTKQEIQNRINQLNRQLNSYIQERKEYNKRQKRNKKAGLSDKIYEQSIGFLRINNGSNLLDNTGIHPESYDITNIILDKLNLNKKDKKLSLLIQFPTTNITSANFPDSEAWFPARFRNGAGPVRLSYRQYPERHRSLPCRLP